MQLGIAFLSLLSSALFEFYKALQKSGFKPVYALGCIYLCAAAVRCGFRHAPEELLLDRADIALAAAMLVFVFIVVLFA
jgi:succinate dehydrogenase/fumarate reductase cytochrome b subunit